MQGHQNSIKNYEAKNKIKIKVNKNPAVRGPIFGPAENETNNGLAIIKIRRMPVGEGQGANGQLRLELGFRRLKKSAKN